MKTKVLRFCAIALAACAMALPSRADYAPNFAAAPYAIDQTVVGVDGWDSRLKTAPSNPDSARLVALRWNDYKPAIIFRSASLKSAFPAATGEKINISFQVALTFPETGKLRELRIWLGGAPIGETFFDFKSGLGHSGLGTVTGGTTILQLDQVKPNSFYTFNYALDFKNQTYDVSVIGKKKDDSALEYSAQGLPFIKVTATGKVDSLFILSGSRLAVYLTNLKVEPK